MGWIAHLRAAVGMLALNSIIVVITIIVYITIIVIIIIIRIIIIIKIAISVFLTTNHLICMMVVNMTSVCTFDNLICRELDFNEKRPNSASETQFQFFFSLIPTAFGLKRTAQFTKPLAFFFFRTMPVIG